jgi:hypothetical protein
VRSKRKEKDMCLVIHRDQKRNKENLIECFGSGQKTKIIYKTLWKSPYESFYRSLVYSDCIWDFNKQQIFEVDRPEYPTEEELYYRRINEGFHICLTLKAARFWQNYPYFNRKKIVKFRVRKEDVVAVHYEYRRDLVVEEAVCRKLTYVGVVEEDRKK